MVYTILQIACIERDWPPFMQWHRIWLTPSYIEYIALTTAVPFNTGNLSAVSRSWQLKAAPQIFPHHKVPLTFRYSWKRLRNSRSKNLIKFSCTVEPLLRADPVERPPPLERPLDNINLNTNVLISTPEERPPLLKGHFSGAKGVVSQEGFHCILHLFCGMYIVLKRRIHID